GAGGESDRDSLRRTPRVDRQRSDAAAAQLARLLVVAAAPGRVARAGASGPERAAVLGVRPVAGRPRARRPATAGRAIRRRRAPPRDAAADGRWLTLTRKDDANMTYPETMESYISARGR